MTLIKNKINKHKSHELIYDFIFKSYRILYNLPLYEY